MKLFRLLFRIYNPIRTFFRIKIRIVGKANKLALHNVFTSSSIFEIQGNNNFVSFGKCTKVGNTKVYISGNNNRILIKDSCRIKSLTLWIEDDNNLIEINDRCSIESAHLAVTENDRKIEIGADCMLAKEIVIRTGDSHSIIDIHTDKRINPAKDVIIGEHVWLGERVTILKGVNIADNVIVATGSIVTTDCFSNTLVAGSPAKVIKTNVTWLRERI